MIEIWKPVEGYEGIYSVSNIGRLKSHARIVSHVSGRTAFLTEKIIGTGLSLGYETCSLRKDKATKKFRINRLVAIAFIPNPQNLSDVDHLDGNKRNNRIENLEWVTCAENVRRAHRNGMCSKPPVHLGEKHPHAKLTYEKVKYIRSAYPTKNGMEIAREVGVHFATVYRILRGAAWPESAAFGV